MGQVFQHFTQGNRQRVDVGRLTLLLCQSLKLSFTDMKSGLTVIPAQEGMQIAALVSRLRGNDVAMSISSGVISRHWFPTCAGMT